MSSPIVVPIFHWTNVSGVSSAGYKLNSYFAGTSTPQTTWTDSTLSVANANPVILDANGDAPVWIGTGNYKFVLTDAANNVIWTADNVSQANFGANSSSEWVLSSLVATFISVVQFSVPGNFTTTFTPGLMLQFNTLGGGLLNFVRSSSFGAGITTVTVGTVTTGPGFAPVPNPVAALYLSIQATSSSGAGNYSQPRKDGVQVQGTPAVNLVTATTYTIGGGSPWTSGTILGDDFSEYNSGTGQFTVKNGGRYLAHAGVSYLINGATITNPGNIAIVINAGTLNASRVRFAGAPVAATHNSCHCGGLVFLNAGDVLAFKTDTPIAFSAGTPQSAEFLLSLVQVY